MRTATAARRPNTAEYERPWLYPKQARAVFTPKRYSYIEASTKAGKTVACLAWLFEQAAIHGAPGRNYWWVAPVYPQAKIAYRRLKQGLPRELYSVNATELFVELANGATIWFKSGEKPDNLYGEDVYAVVIDEASRVRDEAWHAIRSTLTRTRGPARIIGNVSGVSNWFYEACRRAELGQDPDAAHIRITWRDAVEAGVLEAAEVEDAKARLPAGVFRELYEAEPSEAVNRVYHAFDGTENVRTLEDPGGELLVGMDFNVNPMSAVVAARVVDECHILHDVELLSANTERMALQLRQQFPDRTLIVYPDPAGQQRRSSAPVGQTDFTILERAGFEIRSPAAAPPVVDRINEVNALFCNAAGDRRLFVHPRCARLIECLRRLEYRDNTSQPNKSSGLDHLPDALGYLVHYEWPIEDKITPHWAAWRL